MNLPPETMLEPTPADADARADILAAAPEVAELFSALDKAVRARRLYQSNNPVFQQFVQQFHTAVQRLFKKVHALPVQVDEYTFRWQSRDFASGDGRDSVPFLFYKDGVRYLTFLPGFEEEAEKFLDVVAQARLLDTRSDDDIVTLLWQAEFINLQYTYVDALSDGLQVPEATSPTARAIPAGEKIELPEMPELNLTLRPDDAPRRKDTAPLPPAVENGALTVAQQFSRSDFSETLYFMEPSELEALKREVDLEMNRDIRGDVLNALFDRMEDQIEERQTEILRILRQLLPMFLGAGELSLATRILVELTNIMDRSLLPAEQASMARDLFRELSEPTVLSQLLRSLEDGTIDPSGAELGIFLSHLGPNAMPLLLRTIDKSAVPALQERLRVAMNGLAERYRTHLLALLRQDSADILRGAVALVVQRSMVEAIPALGDLLKHPDAALRRTAVEGLGQLKTAQSLDAIQRALGDVDREVRLAAARALGAARYTPARAKLEEVVNSKTLRETDLTEQIVFFEAFGSVASPESVDMLDRLLNGRRMFGKESNEIRACAAMALGRVGTPAARASLQKAKDESNPMVRNAVSKALRQESGA
jgi:HEAT repeat protein